MPKTSSQKTTKPIIKSVVDKESAKDRDHFIWDDKLSGFGLKVTPAGRKVYIYQYRIARPGLAARTAPRRYTIGKHGNITADQARGKAKQLAALVEQGICPKEQEQAALDAKDEARRSAERRAKLESELLFEKMASQWLEFYEHERERRQSSVKMAKLVVNNHLKPALEGMPMPHIGRAELQPIIDSIPVKQRGMRRAVFAYASVLFGWAHKRGDIPTNPLAAMVKPEAPKARDRVLLDNELAIIWQATQELGKPFGPFFRLLVLTGQRRSEVAELEWCELDRATSTWTIAADRAKNGVAHIVPLSPEAVVELDRLAATEEADKRDEKISKWPSSGFVLTTTGTTPISGITKAKNALDKQAKENCDGIPLEPWRIHDLRRSLATGFQRLGIRFEVTEAVLNHVSGAKGGIAGIYQRHDWKEEKRSALEAWGRHIDTLLKQKASQDNVVQLGAAKGEA